jgi:hypothetical protein
VNSNHHQSRLFSFIVKIWIDETSGEHRGPNGWHGHITHVPSGERRYVKKLDEISGFICAYLGEIRKTAKAEDRVKHWVKRFLDL